MHDIKLVILDMAGTTVQDNREVEECFYQAAARTGLKADRQRINAMHGVPKRIVIETFWKEAIGEDHPDFSANVEQTFAVFREMLEEHYRTQPVVPTEGALALFVWLKARGIKIALNTGFYREVVNIILNRLGWDKGLDEHYIGHRNSVIDLSLTPTETGGKGRPGPDLVLRSMEIFGITDPKQVAKVGDTPSDLLEGKAAGIGLNLAVVNGSHTREELEIYENDGLLNNVGELRNYLDTGLELLLEEEE